MISQSQVEFTRFAHELDKLSRRDVTHGIKLAKYKKSGQAMVKRDPVCANTLLGLVACLEHDIASMHICHKKAIEASESCFSVMYYSASLEKSCLWSESVRYALLALDLDPTNGIVLEAAIRLAPFTGRFSLLKRLLQQWQQANDNLPHPLLSSCADVAEILAANGMAERDLKDVLAAVGEALSETDAIVQQMRCEVVAGAESGFVHYRLVLPDEFVASYYEDLITAKLAAAPCHPRIFDVFSFSVENTAVYELYDYMERELVQSADTIRIPNPDKIRLIEELIEGVEV